LAASRIADDLQQAFLCCGGAIVVLFSYAFTYRRLRQLCLPDENVIHFLLQGRHSSAGSPVQFGNMVVVGPS
jgi:hypothetical protein